VEGGKESIFGFLLRPLLGKCSTRIAFRPKEVVDSWNHPMHAKKVGNEKLQGLIHSNQGERLIARSNKKENFHITSSGRKRIHWACPVVVVNGQPIGWWTTLKGCPP